MHAKQKAISWIVGVTSVAAVAAAAGRLDAPAGPTSPREERLEIPSNQGVVRIPWDSARSERDESEDDRRAWGDDEGRGREWEEEAWEDDWGEWDDDDDEYERFDRGIEGDGIVWTVRRGPVDAVTRPS